MEKTLRGKVQRQTFPPSLEVPQKERNSHFPTAFLSGQYSGLGLPLRQPSEDDCRRTMIPQTYKPKKKFMQLAIAEAKRARPWRPCHRCRHHAAYGKSGSGYRVCRQPGKKLRAHPSSIVELETLKYVSSGYGRGIYRILCCMPARTLCYVSGCLRLVENRSRGVWHFPGRHYRLRQKARYRGIQMARLSHFVQIRP